MKARWLVGGMEGECPVCGQASGFHTDDGLCEDEQDAVCAARGHDWEFDNVYRRCAVCGVFELNETETSDGKATGEGRRAGD